MTLTAVPAASVRCDPVPLAQQLIRFDTANPPGGEAACIGYVRALLERAGVPATILAADPGRPNLVARVPGRGAAPPLLLHAHVDVVPTAGQNWSRPPFAGELADGLVWGRGAVDMKGGLAMMLAALLTLRADGEAPAGDVVLAVVADEEAGSKVGAGFLVDRHPGLFHGVRYAIGEDGGASLGLGGQPRLHPIVVAEKRACWLRVTCRGPAGHASRVAPPAAAMRTLTRLLAGISSGGLGVEMTPAVGVMLTELARVLPSPVAGHIADFHASPASDDVLAALPERDALYLRSVVRHTVNATVIRAGTATNVIPAEISAELDARLLPGAFGAAELTAQLRRLAGGAMDVEVIVEGEPMPPPRLGPFYQRLAAVLRTADPAGVPLPMMTTASTDARLFPRLGISCYGWLPLRYPGPVNYRDLLHCADERVPADALRFGAACFHDLLRGGYE